MGLFDFFKNKKKSNKSNDDLIEESYDWLMTVLQVQSAMTSGNLAPLNSLPKDEWIYGYLYGHIDFYFQVSTLKDSKDAWQIVVLRIFKSYYGDKLGSDICYKFNKLFKKKTFNEGQKVGGQDLKDFISKGEKFSPMGMMMYLNKDLKKK